MTPMRGFGGFSGGMKPEFSQGGMQPPGGGFGGFRQMPGGAFQRQGGMSPMVQALRGGGGFAGGMESLNSLNAGGGMGGPQSSAFPGSIRRPGAEYGGGFNKPMMQNPNMAPQPLGAVGRGPMGQKIGAGQAAYQAQQGMKRPGGMGPMTPGNGVSFAGVSGGGPGADVARLNARMPSFNGAGFRRMF